MYLQVRDSPRLAPANYREIYDKPCELVECSCDLYSVECKSSFR